MTLHTRKAQLAKATGPRDPFLERESKRVDRLLQELSDWNAVKDGTERQSYLNKVFGSEIWPMSGEKYEYGLRMELRERSRELDKYVALTEPKKESVVDRTARQGPLVLITKKEGSGESCVIS